MKCMRQVPATLSTCISLCGQTQASKVSLNFRGRRWPLIHLGGVGLGILGVPLCFPPPLFSLQTLTRRVHTHTRYSRECLLELASVLIQELLQIKFLGNTISHKTEPHSSVQSLPSWEAVMIQHRSVWRWRLEATSRTCGSCGRRRMTSPEEGWQPLCCLYVMQQIQRHIEQLGATSHQNLRGGSIPSSVTGSSITQARSGARGESGDSVHSHFNWRRQWTEKHWFQNWVCSDQWWT